MRYQTIADMSKIAVLRERLNNEVVRFSYEKSNGEIRNATGTLIKEKCPPISGCGKPTPSHLQLYFDIEKGAWRCFRKDKLIDIE